MIEIKLHLCTLLMNTKQYVKAIDQITKLEKKKFSAS